MDYDAYIIGEHLDGGRKSGLLSITANNLRFIAGEYQCNWQLKGLKLERGGTSNSLVFIKSATAPGLVICCRDKRLLKNPFLMGNKKSGAQASSVKRALRIDRTFVLLVFAVLFSGLGLFVFFRGAIVRHIAKQVPFSYEEQLGNSLYETLLLTNNLIEDPQLEADLDQVLQPLKEVIAKEEVALKIHLIEDSVVNAYALPGGHIVINTGLLLKAKDWTEVQGVLAHEIGHVTERHHLRNVIGVFSITTLAWYLVGDISVLSSIIANTAMELEDLKYSRDFEREADEKAWELLAKAKINPRGLVSFFEQITASDGHNHKAFDELWSTHPLPEGRAEKILEKIDKNEGIIYTTISVDFNNFKEELNQLTNTK